MSSATSFTYSIYVQATPEQVWRGLTERAFTRRFWRHSTMGGKTFPSDWRRGSTWDLVHEDVGLVVRDPEQVILEADPPHRLSYTWHSFTPNGRRSPASTKRRQRRGGLSRAPRWRTTSRNGARTW